MRVASAEDPAPDVLQLGRADDRLDEPLAEPVAAMGLEHEHVGEVGDDDVVGHDAREADLARRMMEPEGQRVGDRPRHAVARPALRPVRLHEKAVDDIEVEPGGIRADRVRAPRPLARHGASRRGRWSTGR